ncbi:MAG: 2-oxoacid:acceptor oxidoreductase family protein [Peptococcaceae bacterium]|nr:2-oxoacid:acceptor oxidoreductase family protein [Peptococcaceae bacterium]
MLEIRIHGHGGQGTVTLAELIAYAQMKMGRHVQTLPFFGMERRGAPVKTAMRLSDEEILLKSQVYKPHVLVLLSEGLESGAVQQGLHKQGVVLVNRACVAERSGENVAANVPGCNPSVDAWGIARACELVLMGQPLINVPMFGAVSRLLGISPQAVTESIEYKWPAGSEASVRAALRGYEEVQGLEGLPDMARWIGDAAELPTEIPMEIPVELPTELPAALKANRITGVPAHPVSFPQKGVSGQTGTWRLERPVINKDTCTSCLLCWVFCPEAVIEKETLDIDYTYCKGCGVCAEECPAKAINMIREGE